MFALKLLLGLDESLGDVLELRPTHAHRLPDALQVLKPLSDNPMAGPQRLDGKRSEVAPCRQISDSLRPYP